MSKYLPTSWFKWIDPKEFDLNSSKGCVLEVDLKYPKELRELQSDYPLAPDKIEIKREILSEYRLKIADWCNIAIGNAKKLALDFFDKKVVALLRELTNLIETKIKTRKNNTMRIIIKSITMVKTIYWIQHTKRNRSRKKRRQRWKTVL